MLNENNPILKVKNISKVYAEDKNNIVNALNDVNFKIIKGEAFGLVGESGCGKSTLAQIIMNLILADKGEIIYIKDGKEINILSLKGKKMKALRKEIQFIFQDPYSSINPRKKIGWLIKEPLIIHKIGADDAQREKMVDEMLSSVGLDKNYKNRFPSELSGGQRQRVAIAIALILKPKFVICDEAVSALDVSVQAQILNLLRDMQKKMGLTYLFISHNLNVVSYISDRIAVMYLGEIVEMGNSETIFKNPLHPYTKALFSASVNINDEINPVILKGEPPSKAALTKGCVFASRCRYCSEKCLTEKPVLKEMDDNRKIACHLYNEY